VGLFVVGIDNADVAKKLNLKQGSIITSVAGKVVRSISELQQVIESTPPEMLEVQTVETAAIATAQQ
jgi:S1-C subfamily serine protease